MKTEIKVIKDEMPPDALGGDVIFRGNTGLITVTGGIFVQLSSPDPTVKIKKTDNGFKIKLTDLEKVKMTVHDNYSIYVKGEYLIVEKP